MYQMLPIRRWIKYDDCSPPPHSNFWRPASAEGRPVRYARDVTEQVEQRHREVRSRSEDGDSLSEGVQRLHQKTLCSTWLLKVEGFILQGTMPFQAEITFMWSQGSKTKDKDKKPGQEMANVVWTEARARGRRAGPAASYCPQEDAL